MAHGWFPPGARAWKIASLWLAALTGFAMMALPAWKEWTAAALKEEWVLADDEVDWPEVKRVSVTLP